MFSTGVPCVEITMRDSVDYKIVYRVNKYKLVATEIAKCNREVYSTFEVQLRSLINYINNNS